MHVVFFACPGNPSPEVRAAYAATLAPLGQVQLVWLTAAGLSSTFSTMASQLRGANGRLLPALLAQHAASATARSVTLLSFSAGYGFARELLANEADRQALTGYVALDSIHADFDADGSARDAQLSGFVAFAKRAKQRQAFCWIGHTDVPTRGYASTTQCAREIERLAGGQSGDFMVASFDQYGPQQVAAEHRGALERWGPGFVGEAAVAFARLNC